MQGLEELLKEEQKRLVKIKKCVEDRLSSAPEGTLRITNCGKRPQYMLCTGKNEKCKRQGEYIRRENSKKGERVRSKSEKILADTFYDMGIEY